MGTKMKDLDAPLASETAVKVPVEGARDSGV